MFGTPPWRQARGGMKCRAPLVPASSDVAAKVTVLFSTLRESRASAGLRCRSERRRREYAAQLPVFRCEALGGLAAALGSEVERAECGPLT